MAEYLRAAVNAVDEILPQLVHIRCARQVNANTHDGYVVFSPAVRPCPLRHISDFDARTAVLVSCQGTVARPIIPDGDRRIGSAVCRNVEERFLHSHPIGRSR